MNRTPDPVLNIRQMGGAEVLTLAFPPLNTLDLDRVRALAEFFFDFSGDRPLILTGEGRAFSAGVDTGAFAGYNADQRAELFQEITRMVTACCSVAAPIVAALNGHALGGGLVLALCADYRLAVSGDNKFGLTEARAGVPFPDGPVAVIEHEVPRALLRRMTLTSQVLSARELLEHSILDEVVEPEVLMETALQRAEEIDEQPAFRLVKQQLRSELLARLRSL